MLTAQMGAIAMEPSPSHPPGWYPDPAGGPLHRYWDGVAWSPRLRSTRPPTGTRRWIWLAVALAVPVILVAGVCVACALDPQMTPEGCRNELTSAGNELTLPPELTLVNERWVAYLGHFGCVALYRSYTSTFPITTTSQILVAALEKAGYRCVAPDEGRSDIDWCGFTDDRSGRVSYWQRTDRLYIQFAVDPIESAAGPDLASAPVNPAWQSFVLLQVHDGSP
jgi:hypothetical protein